MENIKNIDKDTDFTKLSVNIDTILNDAVYDDGRRPLRLCVRWKILNWKTYVSLP